MVYGCVHPYIKDSKVEVCRGGVDRHSTQEGCRWGGRGGGLIDIQLRKVVGGEGGEGVIDRWSTWKGSMKTLQALPLTMLILGGQSTVNLERICKDIARITSDNVDPGGISMAPRINNQQSQTCCALWVYYNALCVILLQ